MRKRIYNMLEEDHSFYNIFMIIVIMGSIVPLCFKTQYTGFVILDKITITIFILDYLLRFFTADYKFPKYNMASFVIYPFSPMALIDLVAILPTFTPLRNGFRLVRIFRLFRAMRIGKLFRYSKSIETITAVLKKQKHILFTVGCVALTYIFIVALLMFQVEPTTFATFFDALYWATTSLTTIGFGDIYPVGFWGKLVSMISSLLGIAIVALPAGIITGSYLDEIQGKTVKSNQAP